MYSVMALLAVSWLQGHAKLLCGAFKVDFPRLASAGSPF